MSETRITPEQAREQPRGHDMRLRSEILRFWLWLCKNFEFNRSAGFYAPPGGTQDAALRVGGR